ncbi:uncharacterized protein LOC110983044 [Acanthaster planci]|uniref:Uncharacterized protein LOC110983044 n=1 Tax=Acanthaster planci TaxID=133434 RepID=A0A8B7Z2K9_ACAPL|nr:uncharacterized protein LOC110983044 [Acanthaster planci]XP_022097616.1 uncharacterized protein LOC110983044 [Acanthaster planci]
MFEIAVVCFLLVGLGKGDVQVGIEGIEDADMGSFVIDLTCNDAETACMHCFTVHKYGRKYLYAFELSTDSNPSLHISVSSGEQNWDMTFSQEELDEPFRQCTHLNATREVELHNQLTVEACFDNHFSAVPVPAECEQPVAVYTLKTRRSDQKIRGQQILYCLPQSS